MFELAMFELTQPGEGSRARWMFPCALCNSFDVPESGGLCGSCSPVPVPKPVRRRTSAKTANTTTKTGAKARTTARKRSTSAGAKASGRRGGGERG